MDKFLRQLVERYPRLESCQKEVAEAFERLCDCFKRGNKLLLCGNGGSAADCEHMVGELMKGFLEARPLPEEKKREMRRRCPQIPEHLLGSLQQALPALSLTGSPALSTAFSNDVEPAYGFAQQVLGLGKPGDVLFAISTSGNAANVCAAAQTARGIGMEVIGLTGQKGGTLKELADVAILAPETETFAVQELHLPIYHALCAALEARFFKAG